MVAIMPLVTPGRAVLALLLILACAGCTTTSTSPDTSPAPRAVVEEDAGGNEDSEGELAARQPLPEGPADFTVGMPGTLREVAEEARKIGTIHPTPELIVLVGDDETNRLVVKGVTGVEATKLAELVGGRAEVAPSKLEPHLVPKLLRTTASSLSLRRGASADDELIRPLPKGTVVVGFRGEVRGSTSAAVGQRGRWIFVVPNEGQEGWSSSRFLEPLGRCAPSADSLLSEFAADRRDALRQDLLVAYLVTYTDQRAHPGFLTVARDMDRRESHLGLYRATLACKLSKISTYTVMGIVDEVFVTRTWTEGSTTLLTSWHERVPIPAEAVTNWTAFTPRFKGPAWNKRLYTGSWIPQARRDKARVVEPDEMTRDTHGTVCVDYLSKALLDTYGSGLCFEFSTAHGFVEVP